MRRRDLLTFIGMTAGASVMQQAMTALDLEAASTYKGPIKLDGDPKGASVLILGAGLSGMVAALELRRAGYNVQVLEYQHRAGGRCWSIRGGDRYTELGGFSQTCEFDAGLYLNPGPWRIPSYHCGILDYCRRLGVALEPFAQVNYNAYYHARQAFGGQPQRFRHLKADFHGGIAELLAKVVHQDKLDASLSPDDKERAACCASQLGRARRELRLQSRPGCERPARYLQIRAAALNAEPADSEPLAFREFCNHGCGSAWPTAISTTHHTAIFQPVGGMDMIAKAFAREVGDLIRYGVKVTAIKQDARRVTVTYVDSTRGGAPATVSADWCLCTIPLRPQPDRDERERADGQSHRRCALQLCLQGWPAVQAPLLGAGRADIRRHQLHDSADRADFLSQPGYGSAGKGVLLGGYIIRRPRL